MGSLLEDVIIHIEALTKFTLETLSIVSRVCLYYILK